MRRLFIITLFSLMVAGCNTSMPIQNIQDSPVPTVASATQSEVGKAIRTAISKKGWKINQDKPGFIEASITVRNKHTAVVGLPYTARTFSIEYIKSSNLNHKGNTIHRNYNKWITLLGRQIQLELANM